MTGIAPAYRHAFLQPSTCLVAILNSRYSRPTTGLNKGIPVNTQLLREADSCIVPYYLTPLGCHTVNSGDVAKLSGESYSIIVSV